MRNNSNRRRNFPRRNNNRRNRDQNRNTDTGMVCSVCNKPLRELHSAIASKEDGTPVHFDCIIKHLAKTEELEAADRICYLGNGSFGVIAFRNSSSPIRFLIKKRIQFEELEEIPLWRKNREIQVKKEIKPRPRSRNRPKR